MLYEVTHDDGTGLAWCATYKREDAALLRLKRFVYDACEAQGLRDRPIAHAAMAQARAWTKSHPIEPIRIGTHIITIHTSKEPLP